MTPRLSPVAASNKELLDTYLEIGIGHYFVLSKLLSSRITGQLTASERQSIGIEISALATASLENLVTWYIALGQWKPRENQKLLTDIIAGIRLQDSHRTEALRHVRDTRTDEFCHSFGIPWMREDLRARRIDEVSWRYAVDQARLNIGRALEDMSPISLRTTRDWVTKYLSGPRYDALAGGGSADSITSVRLLASTGGSTDDTDGGNLTIPIEQGLLDQLAELTGNAAVGLFLLTRLLYVTAYGRDPRSPAFVVIWQELHPARGKGA